MTTIRVEQSGSFWRKFTPLFGAGLVGIAAAAPLIAGQIRGLIDDKLASAPPCRLSSALRWLRRRPSWELP